jgi:hypothetical protein
MALTASVASTQPVCFDPYVTAMSYHQKQHRRSMGAALFVMDFLIHQSPIQSYKQLGRISHALRTKPEEQVSATKDP